MSILGYVASDQIITNIKLVIVAALCLAAVFLALEGLGSSLLAFDGAAFTLS